jgi:predicted dehydrogenase
VNSILIIGYGSIGRRHHEVLAGLYPNSRIDIVSAHETSRDGVFPSLEAVPHISDYEYYVISSKTADHASDLAKLCDFTTGKRILVEKPLFSKFVEFRSSSANIYVGYNLRFHPLLQYLKSSLVNRRVLAITIYTGQYLPSWRPTTDYKKSYSASRTEGGGVLLDLSHELDYVQWFCGRLIHLRAINRKISRLEIDSDDVMTMIGETSSGAIATITLDYLSAIPQRRIVVHTDTGTKIVDLVNGIFEEKEYGSERKVEVKNVDRNYTYREMHKNMATDNPKVCKFEEGLSVMKTIEMIKQSETLEWKYDEK